MIVQFKKASFWQGLLAFYLDNILFSIIGGLLITVFELYELENWIHFVDNWIYFLLYYAYNIFMDCRHEGTFGKLILGIKVVDIKGRKPTLSTAFYRNFGKIISTLPLFYGFLRILAPHQRQTIHDELGKCFVIARIKKGKVTDI